MSGKEAIRVVAGMRIPHVLKAYHAATDDATFALVCHWRLNDGAGFEALCRQLTIPIVRHRRAAQMCHATA